MNHVSFEPNRRKTEKKGILLGLSKRFIKRIQRKDKQSLLSKEERNENMSNLRSSLNDIIINYKNDRSPHRSSTFLTNSSMIYIPKEMIISLVRK
jgi:hypothetical protein